MQRARELVAALAAAPYDVVGSLDELVPPERSSGATGADVAADADSVLDVAVDVLAEDLVERVNARRRSLRDRARRLGAPGRARLLAHRLRNAVRR